MPHHPGFRCPTQAMLDASTIALWHFDGANGSTTGSVLVDSSAGGSNHPLTANGDAQADTSNPKFGQSAGLFDGDGDWFSAPDHADWNFGSGDWTVDCWARTVADVADTTSGLIGQGMPGATANTSFFMGMGRNAGIYTSDGVGWDHFITGTITGLDDGNYHHIAAVRSGTTLYLFVDGAADGTDTLAGGYTLGNSTLDMTIGNQNGTASDFGGHIDEMRISNVARWTAPFTPPTAPYS